MSSNITCTGAMDANGQRSWRPAGDRALRILALLLIAFSTTALRLQEWSYSCELASLVNTLEPLDIRIDEAFIRARVPIDPQPRGLDAYGRSAWADPHQVIVGDIRRYGLANGVSYGVFPRPMARAARAAGAYALAVADMSLEELRGYADRVPHRIGIEVWGTLGGPRRPEGWYAGDRWIEVTSDPHVYNVVRIEAGGIVLGDPSLGAERFFSWTHFDAMWTRQAVLVRRDAPFAQVFPETGVAVADLFLELYRSEGGVAAFGLPLAPPREEAGRLVQYFERAVMEVHAEAMNTPGEIQLRPLGEQLHGVEPPVPAFGSTRDRRFFPETGHTLAPPFLGHWERHGARTIFGAPIGEPFTDAQGRTIQWFERARLEMRADGTITRGPLGSEARAAATPGERVVSMPALGGYGELQARERLGLLGITHIVVDYQGRDRLGDLFDRTAPYAVMSHNPPAGVRVSTGERVVLGVRAP